MSRRLCGTIFCLISSLFYISYFVCSATAFVNLVDCNRANEYPVGITNLGAYYEEAS